MENKIKIDANAVIEDYRHQVDELNFQNTVLRAQLAQLQKQEATPAPATADTIEPTKEA